MSFLAKLFLNGSVLNVLDTNIQFYQGLDPATYRPEILPQGGIFALTVEADGNTDLLGLTISPDTMCKGYIRFYKRDGMSKLTDYEFFDTYIVSYQREFTAFNGRPATDYLTFSPGILRIGDMVFEKWWKVTDLANMEAARNMPVEEEKRPKMLGYHYENEEGTVLENNELKIGQVISLVLKTEDGIGKTVSLDLSDNNRDFEYKGKRLDGDILKGIPIKSSPQKFKLKVVSPWKT
ncbi:type VI secretion system tube protein TssD [Costertonia aggregata]|uniref:Uncharacterized protein n=1 Tax=Costertonia aggregata TaxID=343403 RepID=A0A7H9AM98_9FLAO|nr:type VI secretion system tube protein TssD [Costertonia aggregata]QLG44504.1 hypothetical protein HYG79_03795 [Costertonia aggregata]